MTKHRCDRRRTRKGRKTEELREVIKGRMAEEDMPEARVKEEHEARTQMNRARRRQRRTG